MILRKIRIASAVLFFVAVTLLFLDVTGTVHAWLGWTARLQFLPALLALNVGVVLVLLLLTLCFGRLYCSVICPLGVFQDIVARLSGKRKKHRYGYSRPLRALRFTVLVLFIAALAAGLGSAAALLAPYSAYGRMAGNLLQPLWLWGNNLLAAVAEHYESYAFYETEVWMKSLSTFLVAAVTLVVVSVLAWRGGRTYCNTICPVGTVLGYVAKYSWLKPVIDPSKCNRCGLCARGCKASCIDAKAHTIDYTRCVACMDCLERCHKGALTYAHPSAPSSVEPDASRRKFLTVSAAVVAASALKAQEKTVDGGLAIIEDKQIPDRQTPLTPPGSIGARHLAQHCTACQLCVSVCPNGVLRPSTKLETLMQPEMSYERGYCRPECTRCSEVCPTGAIRPLTVPEKSSTQVGHAVWVRANCIPLTDGVACGNCARHCPTGAIRMVPSKADDKRSAQIPVVDVERCIGCGACENLCPARPFSAIYVEGHEVHRTL